MIEARGLGKRYGATAAVDDLNFTIRPGMVTGFLGPNGAGKTTTMRLILGLDYPSAGSVTVNGRSYAQLSAPMHQVGALLDAGAVHGGRSARNQLLGLAQTNGIGRRRVDEVLGLVGLADVAGKRSKGFSLGMRQRLGIAAALLGDPQILIFDEPVNGLDPEGIRWIRTLMRSLAAEGRTVFGAKLAVFAAISLGVAVVTSLGAFFLGQALLGGTHAAVSLAHPGALRPVVITALYAEVCGLIAFGVGALVRSTAAALTIAYGALTLLPQLVKALPTPLYHAVVAWVPGGDAIAVMTATSGSRPPHMFSAWGELAVFAAYAAVLLAIGAVQFRTRDA